VGSGRGQAEVTGTRWAWRGRWTSRLLLLAAWRLLRLPYLAPPEKAAGKVVSLLLSVDDIDQHFRRSAQTLSFSRPGSRASGDGVWEM